jgi:tRNA threonylcarbamoyladenosine biosynthesis protein TsaB
MRVLAIDTAAWNCSVALWEEGDELNFQERISERDQSSLLPQLVKDVMGQHKIDQILVNVGPGSFTGIRVGLAFARGLSMGWGVPLKGIDSFIATYLSLEPQDDVLVLIESKRQDVYGRRFYKGIPQEPQNLMLEDIKKILSALNPPFLAGNGVYPFLKGVSFKESLSPWRGAQSLAFAFFKDANVASEPLPLYVREADITWPCKSTH